MHGRACLREHASILRSGGLLVIGQANLVAGMNPPSETEAWDYSESVLSSVLADALGGNGFTLVILALRAGNLSQNSLALSR